MAHSPFAAARGGLLPLLLAAAACTSRPAAEAGGGDPAPAASATALAPPAAEPGALPDGSLAPGSAAFVTQTAIVRRIADDARELPAAAGQAKRRPLNYVANVFRGEQLTLLASRGGWQQVRLSDGQEGFIKGEGLIGGPGVGLATTLERAKTFTRPDMLALLPSRQLEPGSLLLVLRAKDQFSEVNIAGASRAWVLSGVLNQDSREVEAAKLIHRSRQLEERHEAGAEAALELAKSEFGSTRLVQAVLLPPPPPIDPNAPAAPDPDAPAGDPPPAAPAAPGSEGGAAGPAAAGPTGFAPSPPPAP